MSRIAIIVASGLALSLTGWPVRAQNQLDNSLMVGGSRVNSRAPVNTYGQYSQAVVTGNVAGGRQFRGSLGYRAQNEFRGNLPSRGIFGFRADAYRLPATTPEINVPNYNPQFTPQIPSADVYSSGRATTGSGILARTGSGVTPADITGGAMSLTEYTPYASGDTNLAQISQMYRDAQIDASVRPGSLGSAYGEGGRLLELTASPLAGMQYNPASTPTQLRRDLTRQWDQALRQASASATPPTAPSLPALPEIASAAPFSRVTPQPNAMRLDDAVSAGLSLSGQRLGEAAQTAEQLQFRSDLAPQTDEPTPVPGSQPGAISAKPGEDVYLDLLRRINRQAVARGHELPTDVLAGPQADGDTAQTPQQGLIVPRTAQAPDPTQPAVPQADQPPQTPQPGDDEQAVRRLDYDLPALRTMAGSTDTLVNRLMGRAERLMNEGNYFDADSVYRTVLSIRKRDPLAQIGRVNAQLGAGVFLSSGTLLQDLLARHPELIAARYSQPLIPDDKRLAEVEKRLRKFTQTNPEAQLPLLLAYLGYQRGDQQTVRQGLELLDKRSPDSRLTPLLRRLWLEDQSGRADDN